MTLNKYASETARKYNIHACTDVTGFSFLGHLHEMMESGVSCHIWADQIPVFPGAVEAAEVSDHCGRPAEPESSGAACDL